MVQGKDNAVVCKDKNHPGSSKVLPQAAVDNRAADNNDDDHHRQRFGPTSPVVHPVDRRVCRERPVHLQIQVTAESTRQRL